MNTEAFNEGGGNSPPAEVQPYERSGNLASSVALQLNEGSLSRFRKITFSDYVREALYPEEYVDSMEDYIDWHNGLFNEVFDRLENFPDEVEKYAQIEQVSAATTLPFLSLTDAMVAIT